MNIAEPVEARYLRRDEEQMQAASEEADRMVRDLLLVYACDFVIAGRIPKGQWCCLPRGWQNGVTGSVSLRGDRIPRDLKGPVGVSLATLRWIHETSV